MKLQSVITASAAFVMLSACASSSPTDARQGSGSGSSSSAASSANVAGAWQRIGAVMGSDLTLALASDSGKVTGSASYRIEAGRSGTGVVDGVAGADTLNFRLTYDNGYVSRYSLKAVSQDTLRGVYSDTTTAGAALAVMFVRR